MRLRWSAAILAGLLFGTAAVAVHSLPALAQAIAPAAETFRFKIGALDAVALKDGDIETPNDGKTYGVGQPPARAAEVLAAAGLPSDRISISIQPLLVKDAQRLLLFDAGAADASFAKAGRLPASLRAAGFTPSQVTDIFISHGHPDHVGGLVGAQGGLAFPNAVIHLSAPEWAAMKANPELGRLVAVIAPKVAAFPPGAVILPGVVNAIAVPGHTPGHSAYEVVSAGQRLLVIGDAAHHSVISLQKPDWTIEFDPADDVAAKASRRALLQRAADQNLRLYAGHFPFPGLGRVRSQGDGFIWVPER
ncbi:MBL fold metallo-hydrolase [Phenylobacterium sp. LjRoot225]|uniref:MBL fold metallo-hydrolase n=1 Tax=Phenylobacterium sp. LjRoot225 TaxID=3342285 RepID=UPI003ECF480A